MRGSGRGAVAPQATAPVPLRPTHKVTLLQTPTRNHRRQCTQVNPIASTESDWEKAFHGLCHAASLYRVVTCSMVGQSMWKAPRSTPLLMRRSRADPEAKEGAWLTSNNHGRRVLSTYKHTAHRIHLSTKTHAKRSLSPAA